MADTLTTISHLINAPPGQLAAGGVWQAIAVQVGVQVGVGLGLFYGVMKFFDAVGDRLNDETKMEIARWLRVRSVEAAIVAGDVTNWPNTFVKVFDRAFGTRHLSLKCFLRSVAASSTVTVLFMVLSTFMPSHRQPPPTVVGPMRQEVLVALFILFFTNVLPDYVSLLETRLVLGCMRRTTSPIWWLVLILIDLALTTYIAEIGATVVAGIAFNVLTRSPFSLTEFLIKLGHIVRSPLIEIGYINRTGSWFLIYPAFLTSIWLWLYAGSGFLLKAARHFDIGFDWFNRKFDIEKKPLQSIGLVSGALVAMAYWAAVVVGRVI